jgi:chemotaxis protein MotB
VVGLADSIHLDKADPFNPINRRISIIVMNKRTEQAVTRDGGGMNVENDAEAKN